MPPVGSSRLAAAPRELSAAIVDRIQHTSTRIISVILDDQQADAARYGKPVARSPYGGLRDAKSHVYSWPHERSLKPCEVGQVHVIVGIIVGAGAARIGNYPRAGQAVGELGIVSQRVAQLDLEGVVA